MITMVISTLEIAKLCTFQSTVDYALHKFESVAHDHVRIVRVHMHFVVHEVLGTKSSLLLQRTSFHKG